MISLLCQQNYSRSKKIAGQATCNGFQLRSFAADIDRFVADVGHFATDVGRLTNICIIIQSKFKQAL